MTALEQQKRLVIVGATGMVGGYALGYALEQPAVGRVTVIGRRRLDRIPLASSTDPFNILRDFSPSYSFRVYNSSPARSTVRNEES